MLPRKVSKTESIIGWTAIILYVLFSLIILGGIVGLVILIWKFIFN